MRACRPVAQFKRHGPAIVGLIIPDGADITFYEAAADYAVHGLSVLFGGRDGSEVMVRTANRKKIAEDKPERRPMPSATPRGGTPSARVLPKNESGIMASEKGKAECVISSMPSN
jgi:hypothetical protein